MSYGWLLYIKMIFGIVIVAEQNGIQHVKEDEKPYIVLWYVDRIKT